MVLNGEYILMYWILVGLGGYVLLLIYDLATLAHWPGRTAWAAAGYGLHAVAILAAALGQKKLPLPPAGAWFGWPLFAVGATWLLYSVFFFAPLACTYQAKEGPALTTEGPYAFSRHPGALGHAALLGGLILATRSVLLWRAAWWWIPGNLLYIYVQDRWLFPRLFPGYLAYRRTTPMLLPNRDSLRRFRATWP